MSEGVSGRPLTEEDRVQS